MCVQRGASNAKPPLAAKAPFWGFSGSGRDWGSPGNVFGSGSPRGGKFHKLPPGFFGSNRDRGNGGFPQVRLFSKAAGGGFGPWGVPKWTELSLPRGFLAAAVTGPEGEPTSPTVLAGAGGCQNGRSYRFPGVFWQ